MMNLSDVGESIHAFHTFLHKHILQIYLLPLKCVIKTYNEQMTSVRSSFSDVLSKMLMMKIVI